MKYKINKEFFPFSCFTPPISEKFLKVAPVFMKTPKWVYRDKNIEASCHEIRTSDGSKIRCLLFSPKEIGINAPCLIYFHGGGFVLEAAGYHYKNALRYAKEVGCRVLFVNYRLAPENRHPVFYEDCYSAMCWAYDNAEKLGIRRDRIGIGGDSAGATLAVGVCMMARDRRHPIKFAFQMLPYPYLDARNNSESCKRFTDTPMWNSKLSEKIASMTRASREGVDFVYYSPIEAQDFYGLPPAYIETAEFDCLYNDGILYSDLLKRSGIRVVLNETKGTMHGFDIVQNAQTTKKALKVRIEFMKQSFNF